MADCKLQIVTCPKLYSLRACKVSISQLISPDQVLARYPGLLRKDRLSRLVVRLAQESYFGREIMALCTVQGNGDWHAFPADRLQQFKTYMVSLCVPRHYPDGYAFEAIWKTYTNSIGQSCKHLR